MSVVFRPDREYLSRSHTRCHHFRWRVARIRPEININHLLFWDTLSQALKLKERNLKILSTCQPQAGWPCQDPLFWIFFKDLTTIVYSVWSTERIQFIWDQSHVRAWLHPTFCILHMVYNISCFLQARNELDTFQIIPSTNLSIYFLMIDISKGCKSNPALTSHEPGQMTCLIKGSGRPKLSNQLK